MTNSWAKRACATALLGFLLSTTSVPAIAQDLDALAQRGAILAEADPLSAALRERLDDAGKRGFDIGMGIAEGHTAPGPGKQATGQALPADQQAGYFKAVEYSITRNGNLDAYRTGTQVALGDQALSNARRTEDDPFYTLGFDIATGLLHSQQEGMGPDGQSVNAGSVRDTLSGAAQRGFDASAKLNGRIYASSVGKATPFPASAGDDATTDGTVGVDRVLRVPNVVGMPEDEGRLALSNAGFSPDDAETNVGLVQPPYDRIIATIPKAGSPAAFHSKVVYQLPRPWIRRGSVELTANDANTRLGFDLDTGKYARIDEGADIYASSEPYTKPSAYVYERERIKTTVFVGPDASMVHGPGSGFPGEVPQYQGYRTYLSCARLFQESPLVQSYYGSAIPNQLHVPTVPFCFRTSEGRIAWVLITGWGDAKAVHAKEGDYSFSYVTFSGDGGQRIVDAVGRIHAPVDSNAPPAPQKSICEMAKIARDRNSPAAPGLAKKCMESGGTIPQ